MRKYKCLVVQAYVLGEYQIVPIRNEDKYLILRWRNEQIYHLRQPKPLSIEGQETYFSTTVASLFDKAQPPQLLFSYLYDGVCIGYGGLVHINWVDKNAEISFIMQTDLEQNAFGLHWSNFLTLIEQVAFESLHFHKINTYAFDLRSHLYEVLLKNNYVEEARLREHCLFNGKFIDVLIHSKWNKNSSISFRKATINDLDLYYNWANDPLTREQSFNSHTIEYQEHSRWFNAKITDKTALLLVFETEAKIPVGQVRIEQKATENIIGISIDQRFRGQGYAPLMIRQACEEFFSIYNQAVIRAYLKDDNRASYRSFEKAGFLWHANCKFNGIKSIALEIKNDKNR